MSTLAGIHLFPLQSTVHFQKTFVSNTTIQRQAANKSPFKAVYPLINADNLKINIYTVVKDICVIVVSIMYTKKVKNCQFMPTVQCSSETRRSYKRKAMLSGEVDLKTFFVIFCKLMHLFYSAHSRTISMPVIMQYLFNSFSYEHHDV